MKQKIIFPFKNKDVVSFPDTDSEHVDVGDDFCCIIKVAETPFRNLLIVRKKGRGFRFEMEGDYSEVFHRNLNSPFGSANKNRRFITNKEWLNYFGDYSEMEYVCKENELKNEKTLSNL